ncbi:MAG: aminotransferase class V-fold PLP-dependent enzyme [Acidimicrobiales bacterium]
MHVDAAAATSDPTPAESPILDLVGAATDVQCVDGTVRTARDLDVAASTPAARAVAAAVDELLPMYASVHRGAGYKSRACTIAFERARQLILEHVGRDDGQDTAIICRNTTEALNHLAFRLRLEPDDVVCTTVVEHHANLLPWARHARRRYVECGTDGMFGLDDVVAALSADPVPRLLAVTGASNVTGWLPPLEAIFDAAHERGIPVVLDAAQLAPHRPVPPGADFLAWSGHKMYAPFGAGALIGPRAAFAEGEPFLAGGGAVELVDLDDVLWSAPPEREEAGSPNVIGAVALGAAVEVIARIGWETVTEHERVLAARLRAGLAAIEGVKLLGPPLEVPTLAVATFLVEGMPHGLVAARLAAEWGIGVRHGCFCAHPYLMRLLGCSDMSAIRARVLSGDRSAIPGAVRASVGLGSTVADVDALLDAVRIVASGDDAPVTYRQDRLSGDFFAETGTPGWWSAASAAGGGCAQG